MMSMLGLENFVWLILFLPGILVQETIGFLQSGSLSYPEEVDRFDLETAPVSFVADGSIVADSGSSTSGVPGVDGVSSRAEGTTKGITEGQGIMSSASSLGCDNVHRM